MNHPSISRERFKFLLSLSRKKDRLAAAQVIVEGANLISQLIQNGILPLELYLEGDHPLLPLPQQIPVFKLQKGDLGRLCDTQTAQGIAALFAHPRPRDAEVRSAFYLDGISDPGNMGTIFRTAAAFGISNIFLSEDCVETSSPKVIRASLGSVWWVPFRVLPPALLLETALPLVCMDMYGDTPLAGYEVPDAKTVYLIGSEARGISPELRRHATRSLRIEMAPGMESLNAAVSAAILAHHLFSRR